MHVVSAISKCKCPQEISLRIHSPNFKNSIKGSTRSMIKFSFDTFLFFTRSSKLIMSAVICFLYIVTHKPSDKESAEVAEELSKLHISISTICLREEENKGGSFIDSCMPSCDVTAFVSGVRYFISTNP